jgi:hypothetical protein
LPLSETSLVRRGPSVTVYPPTLIEACEINRNAKLL